MKDFLSTEEQQRVRRCVEQAEKTTSGEIVPVVVTASSHYPAASLIGALIVGLLAALAAAGGLSVRRPWGGFAMLDLWLFPAIFGASFLLSHEAIKALPRLKRLFITPAEIADEVGEMAFASFYRLGLGNTRDRTGILIFVSVLERRARVIADKGINDRVKPEAWPEVVDLVAQGFGRREHAEALCRAVTRCGEILREHFPARPGDTDELTNLVVPR